MKTWDDEKAAYIKWRHQDEHMRSHCMMSKDLLKSFSVNSSPLNLEGSKGEEDLSQRNSSGTVGVRPHLTSSITNQHVACTLYSFIHT